MMCIPPLRKLYAELNLSAKRKGILIQLTCTSRDFAEQLALYAQGREPLMITNMKRQVAGLPNISEEQNRRKVTWTLDSKHIVKFNPHTDIRTNPTMIGRELSEAFDIVIINNRAAVWDIKADVNDNEIPDYEELAAIGKSLGLVPGAYFKDSKGNPNPDYCHYEIAPFPRG